MTEPPVNQSEDGTSLGLLDRVRTHDKAAWERMVTLYGPLIDRWCGQSGLQDADAADVRQEVLLAVARTIGDFRRDRPGDTFRGWLRTITSNKVRDHWRLGDKQPTVSFDADRPIQALPREDEDSNFEEVGLVYRRALELIRTDFEDRSWRAFWRVVIDDQAPADVAKELGISANAVYLAKGRVLARLREEFGGLLDA